MQHNLLSTVSLVRMMILAIGLVTVASAQTISERDLDEKDCVNCQQQIGTIAPDLGTAANFAVLGASTVTNTGVSFINGHVGVSPGTAYVDNGSATITGTLYTGSDSVAVQAQADVLVAWNDMVGETCTRNLTGVDLGTVTLLPGVSCFDSSAQLTGTLTLDAQNDPNAVFIIKIGSTLTTASASKMVLINGASNCNVFFQVGSSATIGTTSDLRGNIIANDSITMNTGATIRGRLIALNAAVTLDTNRVIRCDLAPSSASVNIGGRVISPKGQGIARATVVMTDDSGLILTAYTGSFGQYNFDNVRVGRSVILQVFAGRHTFVEPTIQLSVMDELTDVDFISN